MKYLKSFSELNEGIFLKDNNKKLLSNLITRLEIADHIEVRKQLDNETFLRIDGMINLQINYKNKTAEYDDKIIKLNDDSLEKIATLIDSKIDKNLGDAVDPEEYAKKKKTDEDYEEYEFDKSKVKVPKKLKPKLETKTKKCENCGQKVKATEIEKGLCPQCFYDLMY